MERYVLLFIVVLLVFMVIIILFWKYWADRALALTPIVVPSQSSTTPVPTEPNVPVVDVTSESCPSKACTSKSCDSSYSTSRHSSSSSSSTSKKHSSSSSDSESCSDSESSHSSSSSYNKTRRGETMILETNLVQDTFSFTGKDSNVSSTRSDSLVLDKTLQVIDSDGNVRIIQIPEISAPISCMQHSGKYLYIYVTGRGIYRVAEDGDLKCFVATGRNNESSKYKLKQADCNTETLIRLFSIHGEDMHVITNAANYKLTAQGFVVSREIPSCLCMAIGEDKIITYDKKGILRDGKEKLQDSLSEAINVQSGMKFADGYIYHVTKSNKLIRSEMHDDTVLPGTVLAKNVKAFDVKDQDYAYTSTDNITYIYRNGSFAHKQELDLGDEIRLCLLKNELYISSW